MKIKFVLGSVLAAIGLLTTQNAVAQVSKTWKGNDPKTLLQNATTTKVYLYNVGTGRFLIHGGDWGTQSRLFYNDTGKTLVLQRGANSTNTIFATGMETDGRAALGCNIPQVTSAQQWGNNDETFTVLMDGQERIQSGLAQNTYRNWHFVRVEDESNTETYTYYLYENFGSRRTAYNKENSGSGTARSADYSGVYMGAAYGENWNSQDGDPNGPLVLQSSSFDKVTWSTVAPTSTTKYTCGVKNASLEGLEEGATTVQRSMGDMVPIFNVDTKVKLNELYQWRIVTEEDLIASMTNADVSDGLSTNLTYLVNDRGFERNDWSFYNYWNVARFTDITYSTEGSGRYKYTWGFLSAPNPPAKVNNQDGTRTVYRESWMIPVRLKSQYDNKSNAKFGFLEFEGVGTAYTYIDAPEAGVYKISGYGFYQGPNKGYMFATTTNPSDLTTTSEIQKSEFINVSGKDKSTSGGVMTAGNDFVYNKDSYYVEVEIRAAKGQRIYFGVGKNAATIATGTSGYYYDSDWVGADQFQVYYLGKEDAKLFDEDKTVSFSNDDYMGTTQYNNRTVRLHRTFQTNKWNSFVFPLALSANQIRSAFGDDARVAELKGIGVSNLSNNANILDFASVPLNSGYGAIEAGKLYLIMPTKEPTEGIASTGNKDYYTLGSFKFNGSALDEVAIDGTVYEPAAGSANAQGHNHVKIGGTFFSSLDYEDMSLGNKDPNTNGAYVPAGSYVIGEQNKVYHTKSDLKTKGFRAWVVDVEAPSSSTPTAKGYSINGIYDENESTGIDNVYNNNVKIDNVVYDMSGRKVSSTTTSESLPKGLYIVNGKKYVVK